MNYNFKYKVILFLTFLFISISLYGGDIEQITEIDKNYKNLINDDFSKIASDDLIFYFSVVSEDTKNYEYYKKYFNSVLEKIDNKMQSTSLTKREAAENLLILMHEFVTTKYSTNSTTISELSKGFFNCVSSSIFYGLLLKRYGFDFYGVYAIDHTFMVVTIDGKDIDVETTNKYGFEPGQKKAVLDDLGKITTYSYVPTKNYMRKNIVYKDQFFLVTHNLIPDFSNQNNFIKALNLSYILFTYGNETTYSDELSISLNKYTNYLITNKKFEEAISVLDWYLSSIGNNSDILSMKVAVIQDYIRDWQDFNNFDKLKNYLDRELSLHVIDKNIVLDIYRYSYSKTVSFFNSEHKYEKSFQLISDFNKLNDVKNTNSFKDIFVATINNFALYSANESKNRELVESYFDNLSTMFQQWGDLIKDYRKMYYLVTTQSLVKSEKYSEAFDEIAKLENKYSNSDPKIREIKLESYIAYTVYLYEKGDYKNTILYCDMALKEFPNDSTIQNNYKAFLNNFIVSHYNKREDAIVKYVLNKALEEFPSDKNFIIYRNQMKLD